MADRDDSTRALEDALRELVQSAPACTPAQLQSARRAALEAALWSARVAEERALGLACAIERVVTLLPRGEVDPAAALPALVMAAAALGAGDGAVGAAWFEIDTLLPVPGSSPRRLGGPDVPLARLAPRQGGPEVPRVEDDDEAWREASAGWPRELCDRVLEARQRARR